MKRLYAFLLILVLVPCLIVPASATTQGVIDELEDTNSLLDALGRAMQGNWKLLAGWLGFSTEYSLADGLYDMFQSLGDALGDRFDDLEAWFSDTVDWLVSIDGTIFDGFEKVNNNVVKILNEIYTKGTLTIGECVKGIRSYIVSIDEKLTLPLGGTIGGAVGSIEEFVFNISNKITELVNGRTDQSQPVVDESEQVKDNVSDLTDSLASAPTIDPEEYGDAFEDASGKFQNITTDENGAILFGALGQISNMDIFRQLIPTSAMLGVISFALFGRVY